MTHENQNTFKDPTKLTKWTKWFLYAQVVVTVIAIISSTLEYQLLTDFKNGAYASNSTGEEANNLFDFIDDPRWADFSDEKKRAVLDVAFERDVVSDPRWESFSEEKQTAVRDIYLEKAKAYEGSISAQELAVAVGEASDARQGIVGIIQFIIFIVSGILILKWIYRANYNARQLGASEMVFTPGWSIGWYFIPIANLWKPYQAMKEIWKTSSNPQNWSTQSVSSLLPWWWFFWIVSNMFARASFRLAMRAEEINELITANIVTQFSDVTGIPLSLIVLAIVSKVHEMQMSHTNAK